MAIETKKVLLNLGEENVKVVIRQILMPKAEEFIKLSDNKWDDTVLPFLPQLEEFLLKAADKIDGEEG